LQLAPPPAVAAGDIADDIDWTEDMPVPVKRRVAALREVQEDYDKLIKQFIKERAELQAKYEQQAGAETCGSCSSSSSRSSSKGGACVIGLVCRRGCSKAAVASMLSLLA
jgi:hypothetical protein